MNRFPSLHKLTSGKAYPIGWTAFLVRNSLRLVCLILAVMACSSGCTKFPGIPVETSYVWSRKGLDDGRFIKPRAIAIDQKDQIFVVDKTARIQVFDRDGNFIRNWRTPECYSGKPCGLEISQNNELMVCDTHYFRVLFYTQEGELLPDLTIGGVNGRGPGEFGFVTDVVQDSKGNFCVAEYGGL